MSALGRRWAGRRAAAMRRASLQGWIHGVPADRLPGVLIATESHHTD